MIMITNVFTRQAWLNTLKDVSRLSSASEGLVSYTISPGDLAKQQRGGEAGSLCETMHFCHLIMFSPQEEPHIPMINVPGQRFTATHGIKAKAGEAKLFL